MAITIGELVAKLRIDYEDFTKGQRKLVRGAEVATKNIEQHYEDLGIHSSRHLDLMREKAKRNFNAIANSAEASFNDITRAHQAMMAKIAAANKMGAVPDTRAAELQKAYKTLGVRPAAEIEAQKRQLQKAYQMAAGAAGYDTAEILRMEQAKNAKIAALDKELRAQQIATQKQVTAATQAATKEMADAYKTLGLRSNAEFDAMRQKILDANKAVVADAKGNQAAIVRANEATAAKLAKIDEMQFGKQISLQERMAMAAQEKANAVAKAYKTLGMRSAEEFDLMRKNVVSAYDTIAQHAMQQAQAGAISAKQATQTILEAEKHKNAQLAQMDEMQYGKRISASERMAQQVAASFQTLGIRSSAAIEEERQRIEKAYSDIVNNAKSTKDEILRAEKSKTAAMKRLHAEQWGSQNDLFSRIKTGAAMVLGHAVTQFTLMAMAAHAILSRLVRGITDMFRTSFKAMADYEIAVASLAAMVVTFTEKPAGKTQAEYWQDAVRYAEGMIPVLENIAAKTLMTGEQVTALANAFARVGVFLDPGNIPQMEAFTALANALPILTRGQEIMKQINTEIRALTQGTNMATSMLLTTLHALDPMVKKHVIQWREQNTVLENIGKMLSGFIPASELLANQWQAIKNALTTIWKQTLRGGMLGAYKEIIAATKELTEWTKQHREQISQGLAVAWATVLKTVQLAVEVFKPFVHLASLHLGQLTEMGKLYVYIITLLKQGVSVMGHLMIAVVNIYRTLTQISKLLLYIATGQWDKLDEQLGQIAEAAKSVGSEAKKAFDAAAPSGWSNAVGEASNAMKILEMNTAKAYQKIGKGALGVRDAMKQAADAFEFTLPSDVDYQILGVQETFEKATKELESTIATNTTNLKALETAWASGNRDAMQAVLTSMYDDVTWTESEIKEATKNALESTRELLTNAVKDREGLYLAYMKKMEDLRSKSLFGQAASILGYISPTDLKAQEEKINWAYDYIVKSVEAQLKEASARLLVLESEYRIQAMNVLSSNVAQTDATLNELAVTMEILSVEIAEAQKQAEAARKARDVALDKLYGRDKKGESGSRKRENEVERYIKNLEKQRDTMGMTAKELAAYELRMMKATDQQIESAKTILDEIKAFEDKQKAIEACEKAVQKYEKSMQILADLRMAALPEEERALQEIKDRYKELYKQIDEQVELQKIHGKFIGLSKEEADKLRQALGERMREEMEATSQAANEMVTIFEEAAKNIYSSFTDTFRDIFDHGLDSFKDLGDRILDVFKDILAQMATLAIARPVIVPVVTAVGSIMGVQNATAGILKEMGISGPAATGSTNITMPGAGITDWAAENIPGLGFLGASMPGQLSVADYEAMSLAAGTDLGISEPLTWGDAFGYGAIASLGYSTLGDALGLPQSPYSGLGAGLGGAAGSWVGATQGAALGSFAPGIGTLIGGILGGVLGGLLGDDDEPKFDLARLVQYFPPEFSPETGFESFDWKHPVVGSSWYWPIADAYSAAINEIQQSFNAMVFDFAEKLPQEMQDQIIGDLAATDFEKLLIDVSAGRWKAHEAEGVLGRIAENYYKNLSDILANTFAGALESFGPEAFFQDIPGWQYLETRVQDNVKSMFTGIADTIRSGGIEKGLQELDIVNTVIANINQAIAPINEIVETSGLTEYELGVRNINKQFDRQAAALKDAGVDLEKFTALEEARIIELNKLADQFLKPILTDINEIIDTAGLSEYELNLRNINKQFDEYAKVLEEVGASQNDLIKLEQARQIQIAELQAKAQAEQAELQAKAQAEQAQAQIDQARAQVEQAQANLRSAFQAEIDRLNAEYSVRIGELNESLGETRAIVFDIESYVNKLRSASERLESLFRVGPETERERYGLAIEEMQKVLGQAEKGNLSGLADIDKTLDTLISITPETYANSLDYQRDFYVALKMISDLEDVTTDELSIQEKMLAGIKQQIAALEENHKQEIAYLESQLNSLLGIEQGTLTISEAINQLNAAVSNLAAATQAQATAIQTQAKEYYLEADRFEKLTVEPDSATLYFTSGGSHTVTGPNAEQLLRETYGFAEGGTLIGPTSGYFASAQFHGVEHIIPGTQMEELTSEVKQLRAELKQANFAIAKNAKKTSQVLDRWDYDGIPATRMI